MRTSAKPFRGRPEKVDRHERLARSRSVGSRAPSWASGLPLWLGLLLTFRAATAATAVVLLAVHRVTDHDTVLIVAVSSYTVVTALVVARWPTLTKSRLAWVIDLVAIYALLCASGDWRSPFYLMALTSLALPAAAVGTRAAVALGLGYTLAFAAAARLVGPDPLALGTQASVETLATHLILPSLVCLGIGYASETLRRLDDQRTRAERLALQAERRRIAWELHDSAKQRVHAAHLVLSSLVPSDPAAARVVEQVMGELQAASADMDTSLAELKSPLVGQPLAEALRARASELTVAGGPRIEVTGTIDDLPPLQTAHAYRVGSEALTNAVRHAAAERVQVRLGVDDGIAELLVVDDGKGMPLRARPGATGMLAMRNRAGTIRGRLHVAPALGGKGTEVALRFPLDGDDVDGDEVPA